MKSELLTVYMFRTEHSFFITTQNGLTFKVIVASSSLEEIKLISDGHTFAVCNFSDMLKSNNHILLHNGLLPQTNPLAISMTSTNPN